MLYRRFLPLIIGFSLSLLAPVCALAETIAVIGTGHVGSALGPRFAEIGLTVVYGSRTPERQDVQALAQRRGQHCFVLEHDRVNLSSFVGKE